MAATITQQGNAQTPGAAERVTATIAGDAAYRNPAGYVFTPQQFGFTSRITKIENPIAQSVATGAWDLQMAAIQEASDVIPNMGTPMA